VKKYIICLVILLGLWCNNIYAQVKKPQTIEGKTYWVHTIQNNEQLHTIAQYYGIGIQQLKQINNLQSNKLENISSLKIPLIEQKTLTQHNDGNYVLHKLKSQEKLHTVAAQYKVSLQLLKQLNYYKTEILQEGDYILVPNTISLNPSKNKLSLTGFLSLGFFSGTNWSGEKSTNYHLRVTINAQNIYTKKPFQVRTKFYSILGYRHEIGQSFYKNLDRFEIRNQILFIQKPNFSPYISGAIRTQYFDTYFPLENGDKQLVSAFMTPGITSLSLGLLASNDVLDLDFGLYELRTIYALQDKIYGDNEVVFGIARGVKKHHIHGISLRADIDVYKSEKFNYQANLFAFANLDIVSIELRSQVNYRITKQIKISFIGELFYDKFIDTSLQYRTEILIGIGFYKR